jgi:hypothetical protein
MFDNYIEKYFALLNLNSSDSDVNLSEAMGSMNLTKPLKKFISSEINRLVLNTTDNIRNQTLFDQTNDDLLRIIYKLEDELKVSIRMSIFEFEQMLKNIIGIRFNYICRPLTTLSHLIYKNEIEVPINDIQNYMEYFIEYHYLLEGFTEWVENNFDTNFLTKSEFENLIKEIDDEYIYNLDENEFLELLKPIYKVFSIDGLEDEITDQLPIESLIIFFSEKGISQILEILINEFENDNLLISYDKISQLINNLINEKVDENFDVTNEANELLDDIVEDIENEEIEEIEKIDGLEYFSDEDIDDSDIERLTLDDLEPSSKELNADEEIEEIDGLEYFSEEDIDDSDIEGLTLDDLEQRSDYKDLNNKSTELNNEVDDNLDNFDFSEFNLDEETKE